MRTLLFIALFVGATSHALCVRAGRANLRSGPGKKFQISWEVGQYMPFKPLKKKSKWVRVQDVDGDKHWIYDRLTTKKYRCGAVKVKKAKLRTGPGAKFNQSPIYPTANKYESFRVVSLKGKWAQVEDPDGDRYWIFRKLLWVY